MSNTHIHKNKAKIKRTLKADGRYATRKELTAAYPQLHRTNGKGSPLATCNCSSCKLGRKVGFNQKVIRTAIRSNRQATRRLVRIEDGEGIESKILIGYTD